MRVKLSHPRDGHKVGDVLDLPDAEAQSLVRDGLARETRAQTAAEKKAAEKQASDT